MERTNKDLGMLYAFMLGASRSLCLTEMPAMVLMALTERQPLSLLICCVENNKTGWCCSVAGAGNEQPNICGTGRIEGCLAPTS